MKVGDIVRQNKEGFWTFFEGELDPYQIPTEHTIARSESFPKGTLFKVTKCDGPYDCTMVTLTGPPYTLYGMPSDQDRFTVL